MEGDGRARCGVDGQVQDVAAAVVAGRVELLAAGPGRGGVDLGADDAFLAGKRAGEYLTVRADDRGVAAGEPVVCIAVEAVPAGQAGGRSVARMQEVMPIT